MIILCLLMVFVNGWTDAPNAISSAVGVRAIGVRQAVMLAAVFNVLGVIFATVLGGKVTEAVINLSGLEGISSSLSLTGLCSAMLGVIIWSSLAAFFGLPTSESHALLAGLSGSGLALIGKINLRAWGGVLSGLLASLLLPFILSLVLSFLVKLLLRNAKRRRWDKIFRALTAFGAALSAFMHGAQDGQKFLGVLLLGFATDSDSLPFFAAISVGTVMGVGTAVGGYKIIKTLGLSMVRLEPYSALSGEVGCFMSLLMLTALGIPVSTTHSKASALMGAGAVKGAKMVNFSVIKDLILAWTLTFPICGLISYLLTYCIVNL